ncbi:hypothetical protein [Polaribacter sp.]|uniref:hypothetical protein n=2 Tax=Flavobacteriaceae TaxID=49546 RepID=UPI004048190B
MSSNEKRNFDLQSKIFVGFACCFICLFAFFWWKSTENLNSYKIEKDKQYNHLVKIKTNLINVDKIQQKDSLLVLNKESIIEINNNLNLLAEEIFNERNRAENIIDKDIDRLNLYMAVGIGFMTLFGIFVPILVNLLSVNDLREKLKEMPPKKTIDSLISNTQKALEKSEAIDTVKENLQNIQGELAKLNPEISTITLQIAINRLFNLSPSAISRISRKGDFSLYKSLFENIKQELDRCNRNENHKISTSSSFRETIVDFADMLVNEQTQFNTFLDSRSILQNYTQISASLRQLAISTPENENTNYETLINQIDTLINQITNA